VTALALLATASLYAQNYPDFEAILPRLAKAKEQATADYLFKGHALSLMEASAGLPLLDYAVERQPSALAHTLRAEARAMHAGDIGSIKEIEMALDDIAAAKAKSWPKPNVTLLVNSCHTHLVAAEIYRQAGDLARADTHLQEADRDGQQLEAYSENPHAARWRIWQLEITGREEGPNGSFAYTERLFKERNMRSPQIRLSYGNALLRRGRPDEALDVFGNPPQEPWIDSMRLMALFELPDRRKAFYEELAAFRTHYPGDSMLFFPSLFLLYAGHPQEARAAARNTLAREHERTQQLTSPFNRRLGDYFAGILSDAEFLNVAGNRVGLLCATHCMIGMQHLADGKRVEAMEHFRKSIETKAFLGPPYTWSQVALSQLQRYSTWPPAPPQNGRAKQHLP
jgi:tetratricopeptide (TPR) repeat protein